MRRAVVCLILGTSLLADACGSTQATPAAAVARATQSASSSASAPANPYVPPNEQASPARTSSPTRTSAPCPVDKLPASFPPVETSSRNLVLATLAGGSQTVVRDVTDINHPATVSIVTGPAGWGGDGWASPSFVDSTTVAYVADYYGPLVRLPLSGVGRESMALGCAPATIVTYRWSPDGQSFSYVLEPAAWVDTPGASFEWHLVSGGVDKVIGHAPPWCHCGNGSDIQSVSVAFSPDGRYVSLIDSFGRGMAVQVRRIDGSAAGRDLPSSPDTTNPITMGVWSGTDLFFRDPQGVERWHDGSVTPFLPGVAWIHPAASPGGGQIVYAARGGDGLARIYVVDLSTGSVRQLTTQPRNWPLFLTQRYVWYRGERLCGQNEPGMCLHTTFTGKTYIYDLQSGAEWESIITDIADVWPHAA